MPGHNCVNFPISRELDIVASRVCKYPVISASKPRQADPTEGDITLSNLVQANANALTYAYFIFFSKIHESILVIEPFTTDGKRIAIAF